MDRKEIFQAKLWPHNLSPGYEIWFAVLIDKKKQKAFWVRYSIFIPENPKEPSLAIVWASFFDVQENSKHCFATQSFSLEKISVNENNYQYPQGSLSLDALSGHIKTTKGMLKWDLHFEHRFSAFDYTPELVKNTFVENIAATKSASCSPFAKINGTITLDAEKYFIEQAIGTLTHIWGTGRIEKLCWIFVPCFDDDEQEFALEVACIKLKRFLPALTFVKLVHRGKMHRKQTLTQLLFSKVRFQYPALSFKLKVGKYSIHGTAKMDQKQITPYIYRDPNGKKRYIEQSDTGSLKGHVSIGKEQHHMLCKSGAAVEFHGLKKWSEQSYLDPVKSRKGN